MDKKRVLVSYGVDIDAVAGWLGSYKGEDSTSDISRGKFEIYFDCCCFLCIDGFLFFGSLAGCVCMYVYMYMYIYMCVLHGHMGFKSWKGDFVLLRFEGVRDWMFLSLVKLRHTYICTYVHETSSLSGNSTPALTLISNVP